MPSKVDKLKERVARLVVEIDALEDEVSRLEAEDLQPLVDRLREKIRSIRAIAAEKE